MKTYLKTVVRMFKKHILRFLSLVAIVFVSVGFISGIGSSADVIKSGIIDYYKNQNVSDFIVKSNTGRFTVEQIAAIKSLYGKENVETGLSVDLPAEDEDGVKEKRSVRLYFLDFENWEINKPELIDGEWITEKDPSFAYAEMPDNVIKGYAVGEEAEIDIGKGLDLPLSYKLKVTVKGGLKSPLAFGKDGEPSYRNPEGTEIPDTIGEIYKLDLLENILYVSKEISSLIPEGDLYIRAADRTLFKGFTRRYRSYVAEQKKAIEGVLGTDISIITLEENYSFKSVLASAEKVRAIGNILMLIFLAVTVLITYSSMTRLMEEERAQTACLETLGYSAKSVVARYVLFAVASLAAGGVVAFFVGYGLTRLMSLIFTYSYCMPPVPLFVTPYYFFLAFLTVAGMTVLSVVLLGRKMTKAPPAQLLRPAPPKSGKKIFLEKIPFLWKRLSFKYKSSFRNAFRYKNRFFMMVVSVAVSMGLVFAGLALLDICLFTDFGSASIVGISLVVVAFAGMLTAIVINILTTVNISERSREIATLEVLGYRDKEVCGYIYREIYINTFIGLIFGYPVGMGLATLIFRTMGFGTVGGVSWFMWLLAPCIVLLLTFLVTLFLSPKILGTDMNESLKAVE